MKPLKAFVLAAALSIGSASAATMQMDLLDYTRGQDVHINANGTAEFGFAGVMTGSIGGLGTFGVFCVDLFTFIDVPGTYDVNIKPTSAVSNGGNVGYLYNKYYYSLSTPDDFAALQIAIWDVVHDGGDGRLLGSVQEDTGNPWSAAFRARVDQFITEGMANTSTNASVFENALGPLTEQTLFGLVTPEPSSYVLMSSGFIALGLLRRRKLKL